MFRLVVGLSIICLALAGGVNQDRVVNGKAASIMNFPYQVSCELDGWHFCGGTIICQDAVLTAAHCVAKIIERNQVDDVTVRGGTHMREQGGVVKGVRLAVIHPEYNAKTFENDAAILLLTSRFIWSAAIKPIELETNLIIPTGTSCLLTGWGKIHEKIEELPEHLQMIDMKVLDRDTCSSSNYAYGSKIKKSMICAAPATPGGGSCQGDSGGPLCTSTEPGKPDKLLGIVSYGGECGDPIYPGVYTQCAQPEILSFIKTWAHCL